jgi:branched-chain amino acid transport system ATP-binding protein
VTTTHALDIEALSAGYGRYDVLREISLHVGDGEAVALLGPNGAGKTTLLRAVMGMVPQRRGTIRVRGKDITGMRTHRIARGHVALVPEGRRLFADLTVEDNLLLGALHLRHDRVTVRRLLDSVFELFPVVERYRDRPVTAMSGGEQQMVAIGRMMMSEPDLMLLDEPSLGLAPIAIQNVADALIKLRGRGGSLLLVEQRVDLAQQVCDRVYILGDGAVVDECGPDLVGVDGRDVIDAYLG